MQRAVVVTARLTSDPIILIQDCQSNGSSKSACVLVNARLKQIIVVCTRAVPPRHHHRHPRLPNHPHHQHRTGQYGSHDQRNWKGRKAYHARPQYRSLRMGPHLQLQVSGPSPVSWVVAVVLTPADMCFHCVSSSMSMEGAVTLGSTVRSHDSSGMSTSRTTYSCPF